METLRKKTIYGVKWTSVKTITLALTGPLLLLIQARFFAPDQFASVALILIFLEFFKMMENFGISQAVIQKDYVSTKQASSLFFFNLLFAIFIGIVLYFLSSFVAEIYSINSLDYYLKLTSLIIVAGSPIHLFRAFLEKNFYFKEISIIEIVRNLSLLVLVSGFLMAGFGVLGVIYSHIITTSITSLLVILTCMRFRLVKIKLLFSLVELKAFLRFGLYFTGKELVTFIIRKLDELIIGIILGSEIMGIYFFGKNMLEKLRSAVSSSFSKVLFSLFARLKNAPEKSSIVYRQISQTLAFIMFPILIGIAVTAHLFVPAFFGEAWRGSVIVFQVLSIVLMIMVVTSNVSSSFLYAINKPETLFYIDLFTGITYIIFLFLFSANGLITILMIYSIYTVLRMLLLQIIANKYLSHKLLHYINMLLPPLILSGIMGMTVLLFQSFIHINNLVIELLLSVLIGIIMYVILAFVFQRNIIINIINNLKKN